MNDTIIRELRKLDETVRGTNPDVALVLRGAANELEKYERMKENEKANP